MKRFFEAALLLALATGCGTDPAGGNNPDSGMPNNGVVTGLDGLNCEVSSVLVRRCGACHGKTPAGGAPMSLASRNDLLAQSLGDPTRKPTATLHSAHAGNREPDAACAEPTGHGR